MMGHREKMKGGAEYDAFTSWRRVLCWHAGQRASIKQGFSKRQRKLAKQACWQEVEDFHENKF